jgi:2-polyprenyl-3-methyl-5-hydroxy-6-metoxy-1,4-benzoquinol methylase
MSGIWLIFPFIGAIRVSTVLAFVATVLILSRVRRSPLVAVIAGMAWVSAFEIVYKVVGAMEGRVTWLDVFYLTFSLAGWVVAAHVAGIRPHPALLVAWGLAFVAWVAFGFHPNRYSEPGHFSIGQEIFNMLTKDGLAAIYVIGGIAPFRWSHATKSRAPAGRALTNGAAFDALAADYDRGESENPIRQLMRARSLSALQHSFAPGATLLDVGCGTGTEAIWLAQRGYRIVAVDPSQRMLEVLCRRAAEAKLDISTRQLRAGDLSTLVEELGEGSFDGAYSSFGALNTEPSIEAPLAALSQLVRPGGRLVLSVMNRWCIAEMALLVAGGRAGQAFRRLRPPLTVRVGEACTEVTYPSSPQLKRALEPEFKTLNVEALTLLLLPYAWPALAGHDRTFRALARLDRALAARRPFAWLGDHLLVVAERRSRYA